MCVGMCTVGLKSNHEARRLWHLHTICTQSCLLAGCHCPPHPDLLLLRPPSRTGCCDRSCPAFTLQLACAITLCLMHIVLLVHHITRPPCAYLTQTQTHAMLNHAPCATLCCAMLCYAVLRCATLCCLCTMSCYAAPCWERVSQSHPPLQSDQIADTSIMQTADQQPATVALPKGSSIDTSGISRLHSL